MATPNPPPASDIVHHVNNSFKTAKTPPSSSPKSRPTKPAIQSSLLTSAAQKAAPSKPTSPSRTRSIAPAPAPHSTSVPAPSVPPSSSANPLFAFSPPPAAAAVSSSGSVSAPSVPPTVRPSLPTEHYSVACNWAKEQLPAVATSAGPSPVRPTTPEQVLLLFLFFSERQVQSLVERCLQAYMNQQEVITALHNKRQANIDPNFTALVWQKLEEQNPIFFKCYAIRLRLKEQLTAFNYLVSQQVQLLQKSGMPLTSRPAASTSPSPSAATPSAVAATTSAPAFTAPLQHVRAAGATVAASASTSASSTFAPLSNPLASFTSTRQPGVPPTAPTGRITFLGMGANKAATQSTASPPSPPIPSVKMCVVRCKANSHTSLPLLQSQTHAQTQIQRYAFADPFSSSATPSQALTPSGQAASVSPATQTPAANPNTTPAPSSSSLTSPLYLGLPSPLLSGASPQLAPPSPSIFLNLQSSSDFLSGDMDPVRLFADASSSNPQESKPSQT